MAHAATRSTRTVEDMRPDLAVWLGGAVRDLVDTNRSVADSFLPPLILGPIGSGKSLLARIIHARSSLGGEPLVEINGGEFAEGLVESELFGHAKGAFTGATHDRVGLVQSTGRGRLLVDEAEKLSVQTQAKFNRLLDTGRFRRLGESTELKSGALFIFAMNREPAELLRGGLLLPDFFSRISAHVIRVPSLRERRGDIAPLVAHFVAEFARAQGCASIVVTDDAMGVLESAPWPDNVRGLRNFIGGLTVNSPGLLLTAAIARERLGLSARVPLAFSESAVRAAMGASGGNVTAAAAMLHCCRQYLHEWLLENGLERLRRGRHGRRGVRSVARSV